MLRLWNVKIELKKKSGLSVYMQIAQTIIDEIQLGRLEPSSAMPGSRELAKSLGVNRRTVVLAYDELVAQGWLTTEFRRGSFVSSSIPNVFKPVANTDKNIKALDNLPIRSRLKTDMDNISVEEKLLSFSEGPDTRLIPFEVLARSFRHAIISSSRANRFGYNDPRGVLPLRKSISNMLNMERAMHVSTYEVCIVRGSQMGIYLAAKILTTPGDKVVFEKLSYPPARETFRSYGANILEVGLDKHGINLDELEDLCKIQKIKAIYVTPNHQFPTTVMMVAERRVGLLLLAEKYDFIILEDDYDHEFHFTHHPVFPLASADRSGRVIYVGSLSKVLAPGLRAGYIAAPQKFIDKCASEIMLIDRQGNSVTELAISEMIDSGEMKRHIRKSFKVYAERRDLLASLLRSELSDYLTFDKPSGGLAFWVQLKKHIKLKDIAERMLKEQAHIPSATLFKIQAENSHALRLGFGNFNSAELTEAIERLKQILA